ncbi:predicted protein [Escherichia coli DH1]|nr:RecName: Full=Putative uncharacterized protein b4223 [Escherichia coli K-12]AAA97120.1 ile repressor protein [Escherichia coli str. K-12 substr. MG1655]ACB05209.1 predicted protein [Escherichia coli str. K-12 substr. DH10B]EGU27859.1 hypothetical protein IAE_05729 [Escherichia coli XH140A]EGV48145.1 hypothetical protein IAM_08567 [Escherichia coli XH001]EMD03144.1 hypothetical protein C201_20272 [Escherichia coli S17]CDY64230.1 predicted protein [Escherichia coli]BAE78224.1 hypothetical p
MHMVTYPCLTSRRFQLALIHRRVVDKRTSMHSRTASESTGARIHRPWCARHQVRPAWRCQYDKLHRVPFRSPELRLDSGPGYTTGSYRY